MHSVLACRVLLHIRLQGARAAVPTFQLLPTATEMSPLGEPASATGEYE